MFWALSHNYVYLCRLGNDAFSAKDFAKAIEHYSQAIQLEPNNHVFYSNRSTSYGNLGDWIKAEADAKECIRLDPSFVKGYYRLASAQIESHNLDAAVTTIRQGLALDEHNAQLTKQLRIVQQLKQVAAAKAAAAAQQSAALARGGISVDAATAQELQELETHHRQTTRELSTVQADLLKTQKEYKMAQITKDELVEKVSADTQCYRSVGKMFVRTTRDAMVDHLHKKMETSTQTEKEMEQKIEYLDKQLKSQQQNIQELVASSSSGGGVATTAASSE